MHIKKRLRILFFLAVLILLLLMPEIAVSGVRDGIDICLKVVIPSLFPFFIVSTYLNAILSGYRIPGIAYVCRQLQIPQGGEVILFLGLIGGYPVGAKLISDMYCKKQLPKDTAELLLGYCNNAGPAFIFGIAGSVFSSPLIPFVLWGIHIISAIITGLLLPKPSPTHVRTHNLQELSLSDAIKNSISVTATVCGWIIAFRILFYYLQAWFSNLFQTIGGIILTGILELSNGCILIPQIDHLQIQFILYSVFFAFGGICVFLQTAAVTDSLDTRYYLHGKIMQTCISLCAAILISPLLFPEAISFFPNLLSLFIVATIALIFFKWHAKKLWKSGHESCIMQTVN